MILTDLTRLLLDGRRLEPARLEDALHVVMRGEAEAIPLAGFLCALASRAVDGALLAAAARVLRSHGGRVHAQVRPLIDTCGTGGDGSGSFNISTATACVLAAAGAAVAKHGNRGGSSAVGGADGLEACGARLALEPAQACRLLDATGFVFLFAQAFHPAMRHVAPVRKALGVRTIFNLLGPLANPAGADHQVVGVYDPNLTRPVAEALRELGAKQALVVHCDGLDEIGLHAITVGHRVRRGLIEEYRLDPTTLGLAPAPIAALRGGDAARNAELLREALDDRGGPRSDVVALNAAAALELIGRATDLREGLTLARGLMSSGRARRALERYCESSSRSGGEDVRACS